MNRYDAYVGFHSAKPHTEADPIRVHVSGLPETLAHLEAQGVGVVFVPKANYEQTDDTVVARGFIPERQGAQSELRLPRTIHEMPLLAGGITALRSRIVTPDHLQGTVPIVNGTSVRAFGADKFVQAALLGDHMPATQLVRPDEDVLHDQLDAMKTPHVVLKSSSGMGGRHKRIGVAKEDVAYQLRDLRAEIGEKAVVTDILIQEMATGVAIPELRARNRDDQSRIDKAAAERGFELGVYCFPDVTSGSLHLRPNAVYRIDPGGEQDQWVPVDQESVDMTFFETAATAADKIMQAQGVLGALLRIDLYKTADGAIQIREVNTRDPDLELSFSTLRETHGRLLASQLATLAKHKL